MTSWCSPAAMTAAAGPRLAGERLVVLEIVGVPREAVAERLPVDAELAADLLLADLPVAALDELHDGDLPVAGQRAQHHAERRRALALAVAGVDEHQRFGAGRSPSGRGSSVGGVASFGHGGWEHRHECATVAPSCRTNVRMHGVQRSPVRTRHCPATVVRGLLLRSECTTSPVA